MAESFDHFDPVAFTELNHAFHAALYGSCPNRRLVDLVNAELGARLGTLRSSTFDFVPGRAQESVAEHEDILVADRVRRGRRRDRVRGAETPVGDPGCVSRPRTGARAPGLKERLA